MGTRIVENIRVRVVPHDAALWTARDRVVVKVRGRAVVIQAAVAQKGHPLKNRSFPRRNYLVVDRVVVDGVARTVGVSEDGLRRIGADIEGHVEDAQTITRSLTHVNRIRANQGIRWIQTVSLRNRARTS